MQVPQPTTGNYVLYSLTVNAVQLYVFTVLAKNLSTDGEIDRLNWEGRHYPYNLEIFFDKTSPIYFLYSM